MSVPDGDVALVQAGRIAPVPDDVNDEEACFGALAGSEQALDAIIRARRRFYGFIASGHPARFAPACRMVSDHFAAGPAPRNALICLVGSAEAALDGSALPAL